MGRCFINNEHPLNYIVLLVVLTLLNIFSLFLRMPHNNAIIQSKCTVNVTFERANHMVKLRKSVKKMIRTSANQFVSNPA